MAVDRLEQGFNLHTGHHLYVLYGPGIQDTFITRDYVECGIEEAMWHYLRNQGFERIVFYAPHRGLFFRDTLSRNRSRPEGPLNSGMMIDPNFRNAPAPARPRNSAASSQNPQSSSRTSGSTDLQDIDDLHFIMTDNRWRSAVIFPQAENTIQHFSHVPGAARKRFFGRASEWARLPFSNGNACFWLCGGTADSLHEVTKHAIPELHFHLERRDQNPRYNVQFIGGPQRQEVDHIVDYSRLLNGVQVNWAERAKLADLMEAEGCDARLWMGRLKQAGELSRRAAQEAASGGENERWFKSMPANDLTAEQRLGKLYGLDGVKSRVRRLKSWASVKERRRATGQGRREVENRLHFVFKGNPGTGKTTVARLMGEILRDAGILRRGHCVEVAKANELVGQYVGHTALRTHEKIDEALDGVLFIDEAYQLAETGGGTFGMEAIRAILTRTENDRGRLVVVVAGYSNKMDLFVASDPGLRRRFPKAGEIIFEDLNLDDLMKVFEDTVRDAEHQATAEAKDSVRDVLARKLLSCEAQGSPFGNAGEVENVYNEMVENWSLRVEENDLPLEEMLKPEDIEAAT